MEFESIPIYDTRLTNNTQIDGVQNAGETADTEVEKTTVFHNDEDVQVKEYPKYVSIGDNLRDAAISSREHDIKDFLGRPVLCSTGSWSTTATAKTQLLSIALPSACLNHASYADKVKGFLGFRAKMVCRVQVNSQRFQQGRLLLHYLPQTTTMAPARLNCALSSLMLITQQPRIDLNLNDETEVILEIPYVSNSLYYNLIDGSFDFGTFYLTVYSPLRVGTGASNCTYTVWCHFEDVEIVYPAVAQSGLRIGKGRGGNSTGRVDVSDQELKSVGLGALSGGLSRIANAALVAAEVPLLSAVALPTAWAASIMSRAAEALGFSKPVNAGPIPRRTIFGYMNNTNAIDNSMKIALRSDNQVAVLPGFAGTDIDEMAISHLVQIPCYLTSVEWGTNTAAAAVLSWIRLSPEVLQEVFTSGAFTLYNRPPMGYISNHFLYYRGSITITFKVVKTEFHSGRLMVAFYPGKNLIAALPMSSSQYVFREIIDLREASEVSITFPYTSLVPYTLAGDSFGSVGLYVVNPLVAPETISQNVQILLEVSGGPDMEFAVPQQARKIPVVFNPQSGIIDFLKKKEVFRPQGLSSTTQPITSVMDGQSINPSLEPAMYCIGERVLSLRQLVKRFCSSFVPTTVSSTDTLIIEPFTHYVPTIATTGGSQFKTDHAVDLVSYYSLLFRYQRGGMRFKVIDQVNQRPLLSNVQYQGFSTTGTYGYGGVVARACADHPTITVPEISGGAEFEMPYYNSTHCSPVRYYSPATLTTAIPFTDNPTTLTVKQEGGYSARMRVYKAAADDFSLGFFIGTIPLVVDNTLNVAI